MEDLAEKVGNLEIEEEKNENENPEDLIVAADQFEKWNELPNEKKQECIQWLDLKTRMNLRQTSKTEKGLVDSKKINIDYIMIHLFSMDVNITCNDISSHKHFDTVEEQIKGCEYILKHGIFEKLKISFGSIRAADLFHDANWSFSVKKLKMELWNEQDEENIVFLLDRIRNKLEKLTIECVSPVPSQLSKLFAFSKISDIPLLKISNITLIEAVDKMAKIWIDEDAKIGNKLLVMMKYKGSFEEFSRKFRDRILLKSEKFVRIKTNNASKHIVLQVEYAIFDDSKEFLQMTVIPAELKEFDTNEEWIRIREEGTEEESDSDSDDFLYDYYYEGPDSFG